MYHSFYSGLYPLNLPFMVLCQCCLTFFSGYKTIAIIAMSINCIRLFGYSLMGDTILLCILFEAMKPVCTTLLLIAAMTFVKDVSPITTAATLEGIFGAAYFGIGRGLGGFLGGISVEYIGFILTFQLFGLISLGTGLLYSFVMIVNNKIKSRKYVMRNSEDPSLM